jgi:tetratricopeptide (TPR) repeat protein
VIERNPLKKPLLMSLLSVSMVCNTLYAQQDSIAYRKASAIQASTEKTRALEDFVRDHPETKLKTRAFDMLFDLYVEQGDESNALNAADKSIKSVPPENRMNPYNKFAYALAQKNIGLDSSIAYIDRAIAMAGKSRSLSGFQDTKAYVLWRRGRFAEAEELQRTAIEGHEDDPEFVGHLAMFEKDNGKLQDALKTMSRALYLGSDQDSRQLFLDWIGMAEKEKVNQDALKHNVIMATVHSFIDTLTGENATAARSSAATLMADIGIDLSTAKDWAEAAVKTLDRKSSVSRVIAFRQSLALVLVAQEKYKEALTHLRSIEELVDPYEVRYWANLGMTLEKLGDSRSAAVAYMNGLIPRNDGRLRRALETVYGKTYGSLEGIDKQLDSLRQANAVFNPGHYGKQTMPAGKVVLAELFTGAECGPCASSDVAFDALSEHYPRTALAILEYHVHIPGPDPMTTNESWDRYNWYEGQGTPTVVIDGRELILGGGPKTVTKNRYGVYRYAVQKFESDKPRVGLALTAKCEGDIIGIEVQVTRTKSTGKVEKPMLHVALVEKSVDYTGANGISKHAFVVRRLFDGAAGTPLTLKQASEKVNKQLSVSDVERTIKEYLDDPTSQPSWSYRRPFAGWRARPEKLNRSNLAIVAWVQDMSTKEVLQSIYQDVSGSFGSR